MRKMIRKRRLATHVQAATSLERKQFAFTEYQKIADILDRNYPPVKAVPQTATIPMVMKWESK